jgi:predicted nucleic acid-binding protein
VAAIQERATIINPQERLTGSVRDPDDDMILECAVTAQANLIITADADLLRLNPFRDIGIAHPRELKNIFRQDTNPVR